MKSLFLILLSLVPIQSHAEVFYPKFATCRSDDITITTYSSGTLLGQLVWQMGDEDALYKDVKETDVDGKRTFLLNGLSITIDTRNSSASLVKWNETIPLTCTMGKNPAEPPHPPPGTANCWKLPEGFNPFEDSKVCPEKNVWATGGEGSYMCCKRPPA